jgi:hypothetical protein
VTDAGPRLRRSTIDLRAGTARAWKSWSIAASWLSISLTITPNAKFRKPAQAIRQRLAEGPSLENDGKELTAMDNALAGLAMLELHLSPIEPSKAVSRKSANKN